LWGIASGHTIARGDSETNARILARLLELARTSADPTITCPPFRDLALQADYKCAFEPEGIHRNHRGVTDDLYLFDPKKPSLTHLRLAQSLAQSAARQPTAPAYLIYFRGSDQESGLSPCLPEV
jgi:hypothetical protein